MKTRHLLTTSLVATCLTVLSGCEAQEEVTSYQLTAKVGAELNIALSEHTGHLANEQQLQVLDSRDLVCEIRLEQAPAAAELDEYELIWTPEAGDEGYHLISVFLSAGCSTQGAQRIDYDVVVSDITAGSQSDGPTDDGPVVHDLEGDKNP